MTAVRTTALRKSYGRASVLKGVDLEVPGATIFALAGVNGAGKTTLIKCLLDFCCPSSGRIEVFGVDSRLTTARANLAYLPERFVPPWYLDGAAFLRYVLALQRAAYEPQAVSRVLDRLDLDPSALERPVRQFSKGMTQKLGLAACVLSGKQLLVLDEPMSGLDPKARARLKTLLTDLRSQGRTIFFSTHALADIDEIGDQLAILDGGLIRYSGTPADCRSQYAAATLEQAFLRCCEQAQAAEAAA
jgi:ABC-2 type transport system ATP-binding protein